MSNNQLFNSLLQRVHDAVEKALEDTAVMVQAEAREDVPKDTQALMHSIQAEKVSDLTYKVTANTKYALYVHEGYVSKSGRFIAGTPYLTGPISRQKVKILDRIRENLQ
ncbi:HK97 gp10 family phage protein [Deinococcus aquaticus]|uniref:HK97 gp10 family phage protein n=1 Tax=Deinococcus aquaticus TaxID=328692 RepID=A0ABY7V0K1_9DEIO|nr:HK97 gp10 family phage protein [Deinococcus aquaticus]WDA58164.1 HK97 gp10 family phage protein [Deinococcus aquaticus]